MKQRHDAGLAVRMVLALLALGVLYVGMGYGIALLLGTFVTSPGVVHLVGITATVLLLAGSQCVYGAKLALRSLGGEVVDSEAYPHLHERVGYLAQQAGVPKPRVAVADNETPNAFAAGRTRSDAVICVTTGLLEDLDDEELEGVLAHEMSHILNRDFQLLTAISALSIVAGSIVRWGFFMDGGGEGAWQLIGGYVAALFVWVGAFLVGRLLSRYREYAADRGAATLTGDPAALASALETISAELDSVPEEDLRQAERANALLAAEVRETRLSTFFRTHPAVEDRVAKLRGLAVKMDR
jgi:heat shock protein HtpX